MIIQPAGLGFNARSFQCLGIGLGLGIGLASSGSQDTPATVLGATCLQWCRADRGVSIATGVSQVDDLSPNANHYVQATAAAQPAWSATAGPNSTPAITHDGTNDILNCAGLSLASPGTGPSWIWIVMRQDAWTSTRRIFGAAAASTNAVMAYMNTSSPNLTQRSGADANTITTLAVGTWAAVQFYYSASVNDFTRVNDDAPVTGASAGNNSSNGRAIGGANSSLFAPISWAEIVIASALPNAGQLAWFSSYRLARYGF